jgi:hypothetical protein
MGGAGFAALAAAVPAAMALGRTISCCSGRTRHTPCPPQRRRLPCC